MQEPMDGWRPGTLNTGQCFLRASAYQTLAKQPILYRSFFHYDSETPEAIFCLRVPLTVSHCGGWHHRQGT